MAPTNDNERPNPNEKVLHVWSKPIAEGDQVPESAKNPDGTPTSQTAFSAAVSMIKKEDFTNIANTPCARQGLLTGIGAGAGLGGLKFVIQGRLATTSLIPRVLWRRTKLLTNVSLIMQAMPLNPPIGQLDSSC